MKILFVTLDIDWPLRIGAHIRKWHILQELLNAGSVDAVICGGNTGGTEAAFERCCRVIRFPDSHFRATDSHVRLYRSTLGRGLLALSSLLPYRHRSTQWRALHATLRRELPVSDYDLIWIETERPARVIGSISRPPTVFDGDDFSYVRDWGVLRSTPWYGSKIWDYLDVVKVWAWERTCGRRFSLVVRCSEEDRVRQKAKNAVVIPNGTNVPSTLRREPERRALFVGFLGYLPNALGMEWFLSAIWPRIRARIPDAMLDIVGLEPSARIVQAHERDGVLVHGYVADLSPYYERAALSVVPLLAGGGTRLKILEAIGRAVPVVSTTLGAFGIPLNEPQGLVRADAASQFADVCSSILADPNHDIQSCAVAGRQVVMHSFDWSVVRRSVAEVVRRAVVSGAPRRKTSSAIRDEQ